MPVVVGAYLERFGEPPERVQAAAPRRRSPTGGSVASTSSTAGVKRGWSGAAVDLSVARAGNIDIGSEMRDPAGVVAGAASSAITTDQVHPDVHVQPPIGRRIVHTPACSSSSTRRYET